MVCGRTIKTEWNKGNIDNIMDNLETYLEGITELRIIPNHNCSYWIRMPKTNEEVGTMYFCKHVDSYMKEHPNLILGELFLNPGYRDKGIGKKLIGYLFDFAENNEVQNLIIAAIKGEGEGLKHKDRIRIFKKIGKHFNKKTRYDMVYNSIIYKI